MLDYHLVSRIKLTQNTVDDNIVYRDISWDDIYMYRPAKFVTVTGLRLPPQTQL